MEARFTANGVLTLKAESAIEAFALSAWQQAAMRNGEAYAIHIVPGLFTDKQLYPATPPEPDADYMKGLKNKERAA